MKHISSFLKEIKKIGRSGSEFNNICINCEYKWTVCSLIMSSLYANGLLKCKNGVRKNMLPEKLWACKEKRYS